MICWIVRLAFNCRIGVNSFGLFFGRIPERETGHPDSPVCFAVHSTADLEPNPMLRHFAIDIDSIGNKYWTGCHLAKAQRIGAG
jgi:hypothetical protein